MINVSNLVFMYVFLYLLVFLMQGNRGPHGERGDTGTKGHNVRITGNTIHQNYFQYNFNLVIYLQ